MSEPPEPREASAADATRRTRLANERTELAWWRTGLTAFAVAVAVSRIVPELADTHHRWPYVAAGVCFAVYGVAVIGYGSLRRREVERSLAEGRFPEPLGAAQAALAIGGVALGLITVALVLLE
jgi:putative membrane protein